MDIEKLRKERNLSQQDLADATGIPKGRINMWEQRKVEPPKKEDYEKLRIFFENNSSQKILDDGDKKETVPMQESLLKLIESNKTLADSHKIFAEANLKLASTNERLSKMIQSPTANAQEEIYLTVREMVDRTLEAVAKLHATHSKKPLSQGKAYEEMHNIVYGMPDEPEGVSTLADEGNFDRL